MQRLRQQLINLTTKEKDYKMTQELQIEFITKKFNQWATEAGFYTDADVMRYQDDQADDVILQNTPVGVPAPQFNSYLDKINYIAACGYGIYGEMK